MLRLFVEYSKIIGPLATLLFFINKFRGVGDGDHCLNKQPRAKSTLKPNQISSPAPLVSIIILTKDKLNFLKPLIESIQEKTTYKPYEIMVVNNNSELPETLEYLNNLEKQGITIIHDHRPFNYSALNNSAAVKARGNILVFLNNDMKIINDEWLNELVKYAINSEIGIVGAKLLYEDNTIQHAGIETAFDQLPNVAYHVYLRAEDSDPRTIFPCHYPAVTGACMAMRTSVFKELNGFNEQDLPIGFNDVDLCLKSLEAGYINLYTPFAKLYHYESQSRGSNRTPSKIIRAAKERLYMVKRHYKCKAI